MAGVPYVFGNATTSIPLSNLDADFNTPVTIGNTTVGLGNTVTTLGNVTLTNVNIVSGTVPTANSIVNGTSNVVIASSGGAVNISTNGTQAITVDTSQNVGIGTSSPGRKLNISSGGTNGTQLQINGTIDSAGLTLFPVSGNNWEIQANTASALLFYNRTNTAEAMRIDSSGNLLVGQTASTGGSKLNVTQLANGTVLALTSGASTPVTQIYFVNPNGGVGSITTSASLTAYNVTSDRRLKENIVPLKTGLQTVLALKPSEYNYISEPSQTVQGFIADELQTVVPHAVTGEKDAVDEDKKPVYQGVDASFLIPFLVSAIQEQQALITTMQAKLKDAGILGF